jgi:hypothetical protein
VKFIDLQGREHTFELDKKFKVKRKENSRSTSQWKLGRLLCKVYGRNNLVEDYPLPGCNNLSWDFWVPNMDIAFEFHGRQHDEYVKFFHGTKAGFEKQKAADFRKQAIADANDITLVVIRENDFSDWSLDELKEIITMELE